MIKTERTPKIKTTISKDDYSYYSTLKSRTEKNLNFCLSIAVQKLKQTEQNLIFFDGLYQNKKSAKEMVIAEIEKHISLSCVEMQHLKRLVESDFYIQSLDTQESRMNILCFKNPFYEKNKNIKNLLKPEFEIRTEQVLKLIGKKLTPYQIWDLTIKEQGHRDIEIPFLRLRLTCVLKEIKIIK